MRGGEWTGRTCGGVRSGGGYFYDARRIVKGVDAFLAKILEPDEKVFHVTQGVLNSMVEQMFLGWVEGDTIQRGAESVGLLTSGSAY